MEVIPLNKNKNLKKEDIAKSICSNIGISYTYSSKIVNGIIQIIILNLSLGNKIKIKNFGTFNIKKKKERIGRNPKNKKKYNISERIVSTFKVSKLLNMKINKNVKKK